MGASVALGSPEGEHSNCPVAHGGSLFKPIGSRISCASYGVLQPVNFSAVKGATFFLRKIFVAICRKIHNICLYTAPPQAGDLRKEEQYEAENQPAFPGA